MAEFVYAEVEGVEDRCVIGLDDEADQHVSEACQKSASEDPPSAAAPISHVVDGDACSGLGHLLKLFHLGGIVS